MSVVPSLSTMKIEFKYHDQDEDWVYLSEEEAQRELMKFLNRFSDEGKRQWVSRIKNRDFPPPLADAEYTQFAKRFLDPN